jgi:hypothetical protein
MFSKAANKAAVQPEDKAEEQEISKVDPDDEQPVSMSRSSQFIYARVSPSLGYARPLKQVKCNSKPFAFAIATEKRRLIRGARPRIEDSEDDEVESSAQVCPMASAAVLSISFIRARSRHFFLRPWRRRPPKEISLILSLQLHAR